MRFEWISTAQLVEDAVVLAGLLPADTAGVVGLPRSGLLPASVIATHLHLPLYALVGGALHELPGGSRGGSLRRGGGALVVVDDSVYAGSAMRQARQTFLGRPARCAAIYIRPEAAATVDLFVRLLPSPHLFEWNFGNNGPAAGFAADPVYGAGLAWDIDGIIVHDEMSCGPVGRPYLVPRAHPCRLICTGRPESSRAATEAMLRALGVRFDRLEMFEGHTPTPGNIAAHKAAHYRASRCGFFVESSPLQAEMIHSGSGKPVICPRAGRIWQ